MVDLPPICSRCQHHHHGENCAISCPKCWTGVVPDTAARATGAIVPPKVACRCADFGFCGRGDDGFRSFIGNDQLCRHCTLRIDVVYDPCPVYGFGCGIGAKDDTTPCDCCAPEQWKRAKDGT